MQMDEGDARLLQPVTNFGRPKIEIRRITGQA
jgi:hypothetical protein